MTVVARRRKRDDDSTIVNDNSQCSDSLAIGDANSQSQEDSMCVRVQKRRRTTIVDQLQQIHLQQENGDENDVPNQILESDVLDDNSLTSSEDDMDAKYSQTNNNITATNQLNHQQQQQQKLTPEEKAQRAMLRDLVFGRPAAVVAAGVVLPPPIPPPSFTSQQPQPLQNPVDRKIQNLVRESLVLVQRGEHPLRVASTASSSGGYSDDMAIEPNYTRPNPNVFKCVPTRQRSNSLPMDMDNDNTNVTAAAAAATVAAATTTADADMEMA